MKFDNLGNTDKTQMQKRFVAIISAVLIALLHFIDEFWVFLNNITGLPKFLLTIIFLLIFLTFYIYHLVAGSSYIYFSDEDNKIIIRFYQLNLFNSSKISFEIPKNEFIGFKLQKKYWNIRETLTLIRVYQGKVAPYPPICISLLTPTQRNTLLSSLAKYAPQN